MFWNWTTDRNMVNWVLARWWSGGQLANHDIGFLYNLFLVRQKNTLCFDLSHACPGSNAFQSLHTYSPGKPITCGGLEKPTVSNRVSAEHKTDWWIYSMQCCANSGVAWYRYSWRMTARHWSWWIMAIEENSPSSPTGGARFFHSSSAVLPLIL